MHIVKNFLLLKKIVILVDGFNGFKSLLGKINSVSYLPQLRTSRNHFQAFLYDSPDKNE